MVSIHCGVHFTATAIEKNDKIEEQRAYTTIGRVYLLKAQSDPNELNPEETAKAIKSAEKAFLKSLLKCKEYAMTMNLRLRQIH